MKPTNESSHNDLTRHDQRIPKKWQWDVAEPTKTVMKQHRSQRVLGSRDAAHENRVSSRETTND
ncbi:hypothetical protein RSSM_03232 [Rhodopirellula sallentina SM41]|uniref:Uncharacterized protein n=1 Tax=Rhodopirellula sallentina SM41 TaxID=1263870 RepID=M5UBU9_9BACT|nr:hypothetical protein RSSM_03232 [Rhodopirellula sallentina SM41]